MINLQRGLIYNDVKFVTRIKFAMRIFNNDKFTTKINLQWWLIFKDVKFSMRLNLQHG